MDKTQKLRVLERNVTRLLDRLREQERWIQDCGGTLQGYRTRYGDPNQEFCAGEGGTAIYRADQMELGRIEKQLMQTRIAAAQLRKEVDAENQQTAVQQFCDQLRERIRALREGYRIRLQAAQAAGEVRDPANHNYNQGYLYGLEVALVQLEAVLQQQQQQQD